MKLAKYIFISLAATALLYVLFAACLGSYDLFAWDNPSKGLFLVFVAVTDLFLIRKSEK